VTTSYTQALTDIAHGGFGTDSNFSMGNKGTNFLLNYNIAMLACHYEAVNILKYLYEEVV